MCGPYQFNFECIGDGARCWKAFLPAGIGLLSAAMRWNSAKHRLVALCVSVLWALARGADADYEFVPRNFSGVGNNVAFPAWGSVGTAQVRAVTEADYADAAFSPLEALRPTARELTSGLFRSTTSVPSTKSALFVAWGQLVTFDLSLTVDNSSEAFDIECDDGGGVVDVWCPLGEASDAIPFFRSSAEESDSSRNPINYATSYIDLDFVYGRSEDNASEYRTLEDGFMTMSSTTGLPVLNADGTWLIADQRTAQFPVTFALHVMLLMEHNRCCTEVAPDLGFEGDEDIYQACRGRTIATFQHITENDFLIRLLGGTAQVAGISVDSGSSSYQDDDSTSARRRLRTDENPARQGAGGVLGENGEGQKEFGVSSSPEFDGFAASAEGVSSGWRRRRQRRLYQEEDYDTSVNAAADVFVMTAGGAAFESALPPTVRIVSDGFISVDEDNVELTSACADIAGLFERNSVADIIRGAILSPTLAMDTHYTAAVSTSSSLFKLPVDAVQRGRDHGLPTYNAAREAYDLTAATTFADVTSDEDVAALLSSLYGGDIDLLDAFVGALAEASDASNGGVFGELLYEAWLDQVYRSIAGDRLYHLHDREIEDVRLTTLSDVIERTVNATDLPLSVFQAPGVAVCGANCRIEGDSDVTLSDTYGVAWELLEDDLAAITLRAKGIDDVGYLGIGFGGLTMESARDYIICEVTSSDTAECFDRSYVTTRDVPPMDLVDPELTVTGVMIEDGWTMVTFLRTLTPLDEQDYDLRSDFDDASDTEVIYSFREGEGVGQHPNANRGAATVNFATGNVEQVCDDNDFVSLHGALMLIAWLIIAPIGIYYVRYRKGETVNWAGREWYEMHEEIMILASEAVLPLGITAVFASGGDHTTDHAHWGYYMIAAVAAQIFTGWMRTKGLEAKHANFSLIHRANKYFHIWAGRFAYVAGVVQCYRGLELVVLSEDLIFSAGDGLDLQLGNFGWIKNYAFPIWFAIIFIVFVVSESKKQYRRYFKKGAANVCGCVELINEDYYAAGDDKADRLMPRTEDLPIYTVAEFNDKVLNGQSWVLVDGAILDVSSFSQRHPGGARLIVNAVGTDVTQELLGEDLSVGHAMSFTPHTHPESAWEIARSLVIGYIEEDDDEEDEVQDTPSVSLGRDLTGMGGGGVEGTKAKSDLNKFRVAGRALMLPGVRGALGRNSLTEKANRLNDLASIPDMSISEESDVKNKGAATFNVTDGVLTQPESPTPKRAIVKRSWSSRKLLERFHVCPLLFRERMGALPAVGRGNMPCKRPVYRYIFSCPGQAEALVKAIKGVCYFNMRTQEPGKGVVQRAYNAFAVRVQDTSLPTPGGGVKGGGGTGAGTRRVVPASESSEGMLCIEMRIRLYDDGAMSKLLEKLANDPDNPAVQLQGPFVVKKLVPPPAHRNVIMIAAGTGINPMVQVARDYIALARTGKQSARSRLAMVWQSTSEADLYGADEITAMQAKSNGLLEVTVLISGDHRKRNVPGAAFRNAKNKLMTNARNLVSPVMSSPSSSIIALPGGRSPKSLKGSSISSIKVEKRSPMEGSSDDRLSPFSQRLGIDEEAVAIGGRSHVLRPPKGSQATSRVSDGPSKAHTAKFGSHPMRLTVNAPRELSPPARKPRHRRLPDGSDISDVGAGLNRGKVSRENLEKVFGENLLAELAAYNTQVSRVAAGALISRRNVINNVGESKDDGNAANEDARLVELQALVGSDKIAGKLQVIVSGPSGFVFHVETTLARIGVPEEAVVLLD